MLYNWNETKPPFIRVVQFPMCFDPIKHEGETYACVLAKGHEGVHSTYIPAGFLSWEDSVKTLQPLDTEVPLVDKSKEM